MDASPLTVILPPLTTSISPRLPNVSVLKSEVCETVSFFPDNDFTKLLAPLTKSMFPSTSSSTPGALTIAPY